MWFSNLICYKFKQDISYAQDDFEKALEQDIFRPCGSQDLRNQTASSVGCFARSKEQAASVYERRDD